MKLKHVLLLLIYLCSHLSSPAQNQIDVNASVDIDNKTIRITERIKYQNESNDTLTTIYLNDWNNAYSTKNTPLAQRFSEEFNDKFHLAESDQRGYTVVTRIIDQKGSNITFSNLQSGMVE